VHARASVHGSHLEVAATVLSGRADAGLCVRSAATALGLDFQPVTTEEFHLVLRRDDLASPAIAGLLDLLRSPQLDEVATRLGGYDLTAAGEITAAS
jgi:putative molybdopterin biosynthesis protein